jgi:uncharacterized membrane protein YbhN (UPF0104 family)
MKPTQMVLKSLGFLCLAAFIVAAMVYFGLVDVAALSAALRDGHRWLALAFALGFFATFVNLWRYSKLLLLLRVHLPFRSVAAATSVSLFVGQWLPGSMAVSEMVRLGLMVGAERGHNTNQAPEEGTGGKARIFVASFLDRACGLIIFMTVGTVGCLVSLGLEAVKGQGSVPAHELTLLGGLVVFGLTGISLLLALPWLAKHPATVVALERQIQRWKSRSGHLGRLLGSTMTVLSKVTAPMASKDFSYSGFFSALAISCLSSLSLVGLFWACAQAVGFPMTYLQVAAVFPFLAIAQLLPIGFGGIGGHQLVAIALFQAFSLEAKGVATVSLVAGLVPLLLNAVVGVWFLRTSSHQLRAILSRESRNHAG